MNGEKQIKISVVDDHHLFRKSLIRLIQQFNSEGGRKYVVTIDAANGKDFKDQLQHADSAMVPHVVLLDLTMPLMDGFETLDWLRKTYPDMRVLILSMRDDEPSIIKCLKLGASGYLPKDTMPEMLKDAFDAAVDKGFFYQDLITTKLIAHVTAGSDLATQADTDAIHVLTPHEIRFLQLASSDLTYKEVAKEMGLSERVVEAYREALFSRFKVKSRVGLAMTAVRLGVVVL